MATRLLSLYQHLRIYKRQNLRSIPFILRYFSSQKRDSEIFEKPQNPSEVKTDLDPASNWLNIRAGILGPEDNRLPFPGDIGVGYDLSVYIQMCEKLYSKKLKDLQLPKFEGSFKDTDQISTSKDRNLMVTQEHNNAMLEKLYEIVYNGDVSLLECKIQKCPTLLKKDFAFLFPDENIVDKDLTVMTLCQKTDNDMDFWSMEMELEREELFTQFTERAKKICETLRENGFWSDFIDPSSGRPYYGAFTNFTFFDADERYRHLGFKIEDLGCCKVISHREWGSYVFVGVIFTNATVSSQAIFDAVNDASVDIS